VVGASRDHAIAPAVHALDPAELVLAAGRPMLLVPPEAKDLVGARALVAWKDRREARRAVADALPLLQRAERVLVVEAGEASARERQSSGSADVAAWLCRHGVTARGIVTDDTAGVAVQLDRIAEEEGADLIVAGAYGHGRFREWALGGVTRDLLLYARRCVLLSH
jgi:nucleotide-binding universal stress UspA family protein